MTIIIDTVSEPGSWDRAMGRGCLPGAVDYDPARPCESDIVGGDTSVRHDAAYRSEGFATS